MVISEFVLLLLDIINMRVAFACYCADLRVRKAIVEKMRRMRPA